MSTRIPDPDPEPDPAAGTGAPEPAEDLATLLREARERAGMTVERVSARTRVRSAVLRDLEQGRTDSSGGGIYARGHVRSIAQAVGTDPAPLLRALEALPGAPAAPVATASPLTAPLGALRVPGAGVSERRGPHWGVAVVAAVGVLVALLAAGALSGRDSRTPVPEQQLAGPTAAPTAAAPRTSASPRPLTAAVPSTTGARLRVRVLGGSSWMRVQGLAGTLYEGVFTAGEPPKDFADARQLKLLVGNAAALSVVCGSKDLAPAGGAGAVRRFTCSTSGLAAG